MDIVGLTDLASDVGALGISLLVIWGMLTDRLITKARLVDAIEQRDRAHDELQLERARHSG